MTPSLNGKLYRDFNRSGSVIRIKGPLKTVRHNLAQTLRQPYRRFMRYTREENVIELLKLFVRGFN
jgi:hypothetical protein